MTVILIPFVSVYFAISFLVCFCFTSVVWWYHSIPSELPPGPAGLPFLGSAFDTWTNSSVQKKLLSWHKKYGPIYKFYVGRQLVVALGSWDVIEEALLKQGEAYSGRAAAFAILPNEFNRNRLSGKKEFLEMQQYLWKLQRRFMLSALQDLGVGKRKMDIAIQEEADTLVKAVLFYNGQPFDPGQLCPAATANMAFYLMLGRKFDYRNQHIQTLVKIIHEIAMLDVSFISLLALSKSVSGVMKHFSLGHRLCELNQQWVSLIQAEFNKATKHAKMSEQPSSYVEAFLQAQGQSDRKDNWTFTEKQLLASMLPVFFGSIDSTPDILCRVLYHLAGNQELQEAVYAEVQNAYQSSEEKPNYRDRASLPLTEAVIAEALRIKGFVQLGVPRKTIKSSTVSGYQIPTDAIVVPLLIALVRDAEIFPEPNKFDPYRFIENGKIKDISAEFKQLIPFGVGKTYVKAVIMAWVTSSFFLGKRRCPGELLAKTELFIFTTTLVSRFNFRLATDQYKELEKSCLISGYHKIPSFQLIAEPRKAEGIMQTSKPLCE